MPENQLADPAREQGKKTAEAAGAAIRIPVPCRLLIFDLDGTLIDSREDIARSVNAALLCARLRPVPHHRIADFVGSGAHRLIERTLHETLGLDPEPALLQTVLRAFLDEYGRHLLDYTRLYPGVEKTLERLDWADRAIVTNKPEHLSRQILDGLGVGRHFRWVLGGDSLPARKPDPAPLLEIMRRSGSGPSETVMIGDSLIDVRAGKAAAAVTCGIGGGFRGREELAAAGCDIIVDRFEEIAGCFQPASGKDATG